MSINGNFNQSAIDFLTKGAYRFVDRSGIYCQKQITIHDTMTPSSVLLPNY